MEQSLENLLKKKLQEPVKNKAGSVLLNENKQPMTALEAMVMSIVNNAMKGDLASMAFIHNFTAKHNVTDETITATRQETFQKVKSQLEKERLYYGQDIEIENVVSTLLVLQRLQSRMLQPEHSDIIQEFNKNGGQLMKLSPLNEWRDKYQKAYTEQMKELRQESLKIILNLKRLK